MGYLDGASTNNCNPKESVDFNSYPRENESSSTLGIKLSKNNQDQPFINDQSELSTEIHKECLEEISKLKNELERYKKFSISCTNCQVLQQKYKIQSQQLILMQFVEVELEQAKSKLRRYEDSDDSSVENTSVYNIFGCLVQLYLDFCPVFSTKDIPRDEMLSLAHATFFILDVLPEQDFEQNVVVFLDEVHKRLADFEENVSVVAFILGNLMELRLILQSTAIHARTYEKSEESVENKCLSSCLMLVDSAIASLFTHYCMLQRKSLDDLLPAAVLEYQHLREFKVRESIYKKIFAGPSSAPVIPEYGSITAKFEIKIIIKIIYVRPARHFSNIFFHFQEFCMIDNVSRYQT